MSAPTINPSGAHLTEGRYRTIVADPPWPMPWSTPSVRSGGVWGGKKRRALGRRTIGYQTMSVEAISALSVQDYAERDAHLFLWTFDRFLIDGSAARVAVAWGFVPKRLLIWKKPGFGLGSFPRPQHESVLIATRGSLSFSGPKNVGSVQEWPSVYERVGRSVARKHSAKPEQFFDLIQGVSPGPYLELFARRQRLGWDSWGNEALNHVSLGSAA